MPSFTPLSTFPYRLHILAPWAKREYYCWDANHETP